MLELKQYGFERRQSVCRAKWGTCSRIGAGSVMTTERMKHRGSSAQGPAQGPHRAREDREETGRADS